MLVAAAGPDGGPDRYRGRDIAALGDRALRPLRRECRWSSRTRSPRSTPAAASASPSPTRCARAGELTTRRSGARVGELLERVGLDPAHGTTATRTSSAAASANASASPGRWPPSRGCIVCDEPVSALDVTTQAQVVDLLGELQRDLGLALVFIAHDLAVVRQVSDRVAVMRRGRIVEEGPVGRGVRRAAGPVHRGLLAAVPVLDPAARRPRRRATPAGAGRDVTRVAIASLSATERAGTAKVTTVHPFWWCDGQPSVAPPPCPHTFVRAASRRTNGGRPIRETGVHSCASDCSPRVVIRTRAVSQARGATGWCAGSRSTNSTSTR